MYTFASVHTHTVTTAPYLAKAIIFVSFFNCWVLQWSCLLFQRLLTTKHRKTTLIWRHIKTPFSFLCLNSKAWMNKIIDQTKNTKVICYKDLKLSDKSRNILLSIASWVTIFTRKIYDRPVLVARFNRVWDPFWGISQNKILKILPLHVHKLQYIFSYIYLPFTVRYTPSYIVRMFLIYCCIWGLVWTWLGMATVN